MPEIAVDNRRQRGAHDQIVMQLRVGNAPTQTLLRSRRNLPLRRAQLREKSLAVNKLVFVAGKRRSRLKPAPAFQ